MTRLSDLLRSAADRAPIGEASVSLQRARRRVKTRRGVRGAANSLVGAGAVALLVAGIIHPTFFSANEDTAAHNPLPPNDDRQVDSLGSEGSSWYSQWGSCGSSLDYPSDSDEYLTLDIGADDWIDLDSGSTLDIPVSLSTNEDVSIRTSGAGAVLLWEGIVVSRLEPSQAEEIRDLVTGKTSNSTLSVPLVNCFDGAPLPAAKYELVVSQAYSYVQDEPAPTMPTPSSSATVHPEPSPTIVGREPAPSPTTKGATRDGDSETTSGDLGDPVQYPEELPVEPPLWDNLEVAPSVTISIAGEIVEDPFGDYIWSPPDRPDDLLTPEKARELYTAVLDTEPWDMAPGTSRWIIPNYETYAVDEYSMSSSRIAPSDWYGCSWGGTTGASFPTRSASLNLLDVTATFPSTINLSYGWVVDGNPPVHVMVTNTSEYSLPGFYGEPSRALYLVKDGQVVAEAWPQDMYPYSGDKRYEDTPAVVGPDEYWGTLSSGDSISGDYLWRDLSGCWTESNPRLVEAGTYTLLTSQTIYVEGTGDYSILYRDLDDVAILEEDETIGSVGVAPPPAVDVIYANDRTAMVPETEPDSIEPGYHHDSVELQVWTSLGFVTITTS